MVAVVEELAKLETSEMKVTTTDVDVSPVQEVRQVIGFLFALSVHFCAA